MSTIDENKEYDINPEENIPQKVYGIPDFLKENKQDNSKKYDIEPEENVPREVYGIPDFIRDNNKKYDINPEENVPEFVYGTPDFMRQDTETQVFEAFVGGFFGPSSYYYINRVGDEYEFRFGFSQSGMRIFNNSKNQDLHITKHGKEFYEDFKNYLINKTKEWEKEYYDPNVLDGTQWNITLVEDDIDYSGSNTFPDNFDNVMEFIDKVFETGEFISEEEIKNKPEQDYAKEFILPKANFKTLKINISYPNSSHVMILSSKLNEKFSLTFNNLYVLINPNMADNTIEISKECYDTFIERYNEITRDWKQSYIGEEDIRWSIEETNDKSRILIGNGGRPNNWNEFVDLLVEYEILFKKNIK